MNDPIAVAIRVAEILEALGLRYLIGGSLASSMSGEPRTTLDVDIVVAITAGDVTALVEALRSDFEVDELAMARAVRERSSVNVFHSSSAIKVDFFVMGGGPLDEEPDGFGVSAFRCRRAGSTSLHLCARGHPAPEAAMVSLRGARCRTVSGVTFWASSPCRGDRLDRVYLRDRASRAGLSDLLARAETAAGR